MKILKGKQTSSVRRVMLYGVHGVGKSTWAAQAPDCLFLNVEDGLSDIECDSSEHITSLADFMQALEWVAAGDHSYKWLAIDTLDHLEQLIWNHLADMDGVESIADIGFGKGFKRALKLWSEIQKALDYIRKTLSCGTIALAHAAVKRFDSPEMDAYDRYQPALHDSASALWQEWSDEVLFASYRTFVRKEEQGFGKERAIGVGDGERYLRTRETAAVVAKNRLGLPDEMACEWSAYASHLGNIAGVVNNGSSKPKQPR